MLRGIARRGGADVCLVGVSGGEGIELTVQMGVQRMSSPISIRWQYHSSLPQSSVPLPLLSFHDNYFLYDRGGEEKARAVVLEEDVLMATTEVKMRSIFPIKLDMGTAPTCLPPPPVFPLLLTGGSVWM